MSPIPPSEQDKLESDDKNRHFRTDHLTADLKGHTARGGIVTVASQGVKFFLAMAATVVLARLLTPQDYGLVGMVAVVTGFISMFKDLGLSAATIQKEEVTDDQISTLFWINVGLSVGVMLLTVAIAPGVAWFYGEPRLTMITVGFSAGFLFGGFTVQHEALLRRQMRFSALASIEIISIVAGMVGAIVLAWRGAAYWALVSAQLVQGFAYAIGIWIVCGWRPARPVRYSGVRSMLAFGGNLTGFHIVNYFARNLDNMLIGRFWGSAQLGLYAKAYQLLMLPIDQINEPITSVAVPALSRLTEFPERYRRAYGRLLEKIAMLTMPLMAFMIVTSDWFVLLLLGPRWAEVSRIFALLGIAGMIQPICNTSGWLFISQGRTHHMFQWGLIGSTIVVISIVAGLPWGAVGVASSYSITFLLIVAPLLFWFVGREGPVRTMDFYRVIAPSACAAMFVLAALFVFRKWAPISQPFVRLLLSFLIACVTTVVVLASLPAGRRSLLDLKEFARLLSNRGELRTVI